MLSLLQAQPLIFAIVIGIFGLAIGSFLNVVIYRLPRIMNQQWRVHCLEYLDLPPEKIEKISLARPRSHCPACKTMVPWKYNIPIISFLILRGKCAFCQAHISWRYPIIELISAILAAFAAYHFGFHWQVLPVLILTWSLLASIFIDIEHQILPDDITLSLLWLGLFCSLFRWWATPENAILGAIIGYSSLWLFAQCFQYFRKKEGMGYGDFKLFAMFGAWLGWHALLPIILLASLMGAVIGVIFLIIKKASRETPIPFGPYLAIAGWIFLFWGEPIIHWYRGLFY